MNSVPRQAAVLPIRDLSAAARLEELSGGQFAPELLELLSRGLFRSTRCVLLIGESGVGKSTLLEELARQASAGGHQHLASKRFLAVDCRRISKADAGPFLAALGQGALREPEAVWCLDDAGSLLGDSQPLRTFINLVQQAQGGVIVTLTREQAVELAASDAQWFKRFTKVELEEPEEVATLEIVQQHAHQLAEEFLLEITPEVVERTVVLTSHFLLSERHPAKAIRLLRQVCEDLEFDRSEQGAETQQVQLNDVIHALSERTGIPSDTLSGNAIQDDFETALTAAVVGQDPAIVEVTKELRFIKAGLNEPGRVPCSCRVSSMSMRARSEVGVFRTPACSLAIRNYFARR